MIDPVWLYQEIDDLKSDLEVAIKALRKIDEPMKYHHWEEEPYTRAGCFQFVAHEARIELGDVDRTPDRNDK